LLELIKFSTKDKHYSYFQSIFNQKLCTKDIKMPSSKAWVFRSMIYKNEEDGMQKFGSKS